MITTKDCFSHINTEFLLILFVNLSTVIPTNEWALSILLVKTEPDRKGLLMKICLIFNRYFNGLIG